MSKLVPVMVLDEAKLVQVAGEVLRRALVAGEGLLSEAEWVRRICDDVGARGEFAHDVVERAVRRVVRRIQRDAGLQAA
jgi:hypothetical protein